MPQSSAVHVSLVLEGGPGLQCQCCSRLWSQRQAAYDVNTQQEDMHYKGMCAERA